MEVAKKAEVVKKAVGKVSGQAAAEYGSTYDDNYDADYTARSAEELLQGLNAQQAQAVQYQGPALLIGAGAGSGKTRVLTRRIAWVLSQWHAWPSQILAITFTNKAAAEMKERLAQLIGNVAQRMWVSTFHSACVRILRRDGQAIGLGAGFSIYDSADCERLVKIICAEYNIDVKRYTPRSILAKISDCKNALQSWRSQLEQYAPTFKPGSRGYHIARLGDIHEIVAVVYAEYQYRLAMANAVDFDDLIVRTVELLRTQPAVAQYYHHKFRYILVDEYQDTNHAQYVLIRQLAGVDQATNAHGYTHTSATAQKSAKDANALHNPAEQPAWITVVGDSDQSIYAFRGADIRNIQDFEQDFPQAHTIMLEQNYRSTQTILDAANAVIAHNIERKPKKLWTALGEGDKIQGYVADSAQQEAQWVAKRLAELSAAGTYQYADMAIMYRANAQSRLLEEALINAGIPYQLVGGTRFYERKEIKDALAYLQALVNPADDVNMRRILNVPKRGLGARAEAIITDYAQSEGMPFWQGLQRIVQGEAPQVTLRSMKQLREFAALMLDLREFAVEHDAKPSDIVAQVLERSGLVKELQASQDLQDHSRVENLSQLQSVAAEYEQNTTDPTLAGFLETTALVSDSDQIPDDAEHGKVTLMTLHTAKGLEYPVVFLTGMEQGTFPHARALEDASQLAEERRLAYVGITRAQRRLYVSRAEVRSQWGQARDMSASQFLEEIPEDLISWERATGFGGMMRGWQGSAGLHGAAHDDDEFGGWDDETYSIGDSARDSARSTYGSGSYGGASSSYGRSYGKSGGFSSSSYGNSSYGSSSYGRSSYGSSSYGTRSKSSGTHSGSKRSNGALSTRRANGTSRASSSGISAQTAQHASAAPRHSIEEFHIGDKVSHDRFGLGTVTALQEKGINSVITVDFGSEGTKRLLLRVAPLELL